MIITGKRIILRKITAADLPFFVRWLNDPKVNCFLSMQPPTLAEERKWFAGLKKKSDQVLAIQIKDGDLIGTTGLHRISKKNNSASFGIFIGDKRYWNSGLGTEATSLMVDYGFKKNRLHRIELSVYEYNKRAIHVYEKIGFRHEGIKKQARKRGNKYYDEYMMAILKPEWKIK